MNHVTHHLSYTNIRIFSPEICKFCYIKKYRYSLHFDTWFLILLTFLVFKDRFNKYCYTLMLSAKMDFLGLLKTKVFWNKGYDVIISVHDVTNKILSRNWNYIVYAIMWPKFRNSSLSMRDVIITSIL